MKTKYQLKKTLVFTIAILFISIIIVPCISSINIESKKNPISKTNFFDPFEEGWKYRKKITIDFNKVTGNLVNFPVLVSTTDTDIVGKAQSDGDDILFMDDKEEANQLYHEIEFFDVNTGKLASWVNIPFLSGTEETYFYIYYGNPNVITQQNPTMVWDDYCVGIWHMNDYTTSSIQDSTSNNNDGTKRGLNEPIETSNGKIAKAQDFDGINDFISTNELLSDGSDFTMSLWVNPNIFYNSAAPQTRMLNDRGRITIEHGNPIRAGSDAISIRIYDDSEQHYTSYKLDLAPGTWYFFTGTFDGSHLKFYINGNLVDSTIGDWDGLNYDSVIGSDREQNQYFFDGIIDELRISNTVRTPEWISTFYNTVNYPSDFLTFGPEERTRTRTYENFLFQQFLKNHPNLLLLMRYLLELYQ